MTEPIIFRRIDKVIDELIEHGAILPKHRANLESRLPIVCGLPRPPPSNGSKYSRAEIASHARMKQARNVYSSILDRSPLLFLPFIIAVGPGASPSINISETKRRFSRQSKIRLDASSRSFLQDVAERNNIVKSREFQQALAVLFPRDPMSTAPLTSANPRHVADFDTCDLRRISTTFGRLVSEHVMLAHEHVMLSHVNKPSRSGSQLTKCIRAYRPDKDEDIIFHLDVGNAIDLAKILFPQSLAVKFPVAVAGPLKDFAEGLRPDASSSHIDYGYFTMLGTDVVGIGSVFNAATYDALLESQLRQWEEEHFLLDVTDCLTMTIMRGTPKYGTIRLRTQFWKGIQLINQLYSL